MKRLRKKLRERGKIRLSEYFKDLKEGDIVALIPSLGIPLNYHRRYRGLTGIIKGFRGTHAIVEVKKGKKIKTIITHPIHLKKLK